MRISDWSSDVCSSDLCLDEEIGRQQTRITDQRVEQFADHALGLDHHPIDLMVPVQLLTQEALELVVLGADGGRERDQRDRARTHVGKGLDERFAQGMLRMCNQNGERSAERPVGKGGVRKGRSWWWP